MANYEVVETFVSINGEGTRAGELAVFVRMKGCNLNCAFCDTKWANEPEAEFQSMTELDILEYVRKTGVRNVTLTGGEPLLRKDMGLLIETLLADQERRVEIETNGSVDLTPYMELAHRPSFTMDYKLSASQMEAHMCLSNFALLDARDTVKFVVGSRTDMERAAEIIDQYHLIGRTAIYFSPVFGSIEPSEMVDFLIEKKMNDARIQLQLHKFIWDPDKKGV